MSIIKKQNNFFFFENSLGFPVHPSRDVHWYSKKVV